MVQIHLCSPNCHVAQSVEQGTVNALVAGSSPAVAAMKEVLSSEFLQKLQEKEAKQTLSDRVEIAWKMREAVVFDITKHPRYKKVAG